MKVDDLRFSERHEGPTPNDGAYSIAFFLDAERKPCTKEEAKYIEIHEYDADDKSIFRTWLEPS